MPKPADIIATYIRAKDGNRPHLLRTMFADTAELEMVVKSDAISFPPRCVGRAAIEDVLVRQFGQSFENVYTLCLTTPSAGEREFQCDWLVGMSEKVDGAVRVGFGTYRWHFEAADPCLAHRLLITVEKMEVLPPESLLAVMAWMSSLPYPWCRVDVAIQTAPDLESLTRMLALLRGLQPVGQADAHKLRLSAIPARCAVRVTPDSARSTDDAARSFPDLLAYLRSLPAQPWFARARLTGNGGPRSRHFTPRNHGKGDVTAFKCPRERAYASSPESPRSSTRFSGPAARLANPPSSRRG